MKASARTMAVMTAVLILAPRLAGSEIEDGRFLSPQWGVALTAPGSWQLSERTSYPNILLWMSRRESEGKMLLTAEKLTASGGPLAYARRTKAVLESMKFAVRSPQVHPATGAYWMDLDDGTSYLRQAFLTRGEIGYTLTLSAPSSLLRNQHLRAFDTTLRSIELFDRRLEPQQSASEDDSAATEAP